MFRRPAAADSMASAATVAAGRAEPAEGDAEVAEPAAEVAAEAVADEVVAQPIKRGHRGGKELSLPPTFAS